MEKYKSLLSFFSSFLTVAAVAGFAGVLAEQLATGKRAGVAKKLRYLCALAVTASLASPLPGFFSSLKSAFSSPFSTSDQIFSYGSPGEALGGALFSTAAAKALEKNIGEDLRARLSLSGEDLHLHFAVGEVTDAPSEVAGAEEAKKRKKKEEKENTKDTKDRLFTLEKVQVVLYTLRAVAKTDEIKRYLAQFSCPVEIEEDLLGASDPKMKKPEDGAGNGRK